MLCTVCVCVGGGRDRERQCLTVFPREVGHTGKKLAITSSVQFVPNRSCRSSRDGEVGVSEDSQKKVDRVGTISTSFSKLAAQRHQSMIMDVLGFGGAGITTKIVPLLKGPPFWWREVDHK